VDVDRQTTDHAREFETLTDRNITAQGRL